MMRMFFGLDLAGADKLAIDTWRNKMLPPLAQPVSTANLHITLAFLGEVPSSHYESVFTAARQVCGQAFDLQINQTGYWSKPKVYWIGPTSIPDELLDLARQLRSQLAYQGLSTDPRPYQPHISLFRKLRENPPAPLCEPDMQLSFKSFCLFESHSSSSGVNYRVLEQWPLAVAGSVRERLARGELD